MASPPERRLIRQLQRSLAIPLAGAARWASLAVVAPLAPTSLAAQQVPARSTPLVISGATIIDGRGGPPRQSLTITVRAGRIASIDTGVVSAAGARRIDARGKYLIPGICDAHVHFYHGARMLTRLLAHGVTCVQHMWGQVDDVVRWRREIDAGERIGPTILSVAGEWPDSAPSWRAGPLLDSLLAQGATFVKIGDDHPAAWLSALSVEARRRSVPFLGHLPFALRPRDAIALGQKRIEHLSPALLVATSARDSELAPRWSAAAMARNRAELTASALAALDAPSAQNEASLLRALVEGGVAVTPTLVNHRATARIADSNFAADPRLRLFEDTTRRAWADYVTRRRLALQPGDTVLARRIFEAQQHLVLAMKRAGVRILAGSDAGDHYRYYGSSLHDELELLTAAGLTPLDALQAATRNVAEDVGLLADRGTVAVGKVADLVLLDANPADDIRNVRRGHLVIARGRPYSPRELHSVARRLP